MLVRCFIWNDTYGPEVSFHSCQGSALVSPVPIVQVKPYAVSDCDTNLCHAAVFPVTLIPSSHAFGWIWKEYHVVAIADGT